ncbi:hypothetical protein LWI29_008667 [Acer saccharum]|uniref:CYTH domain-containing protein n=1 Tax=Acer saccharum TaxID=4024 RepID=A0AA39RD42_ACESA|nr:hypothetical protein LWI29_008667 [Acer saccharum]
MCGPRGEAIKVWNLNFNLRVKTLFPQIYLLSRINSPGLAERNAEEKSKQNRSQDRRQRRARTSPQTHQYCFHHRQYSHHHLFLRRPPPPLSPKPLLQISTHRTISLTSTHPMEVEVKLRLKDASAHKQVTTLLSPFHVKTLNQHNLFFDTPTSSLSSQRAVLRLRFFDKDARCIVSLKAKPTLVDGVSRVEEDEEELDPVAATDCVENPAKLYDIDSRVVRRAREEFGLENGVGLVCLGGFENVREVYDWKGLKLEVDETKYAFGISYEVECETENPEEAKRVLEEFLNENGIVYIYSEMTKFGSFRAGKLPQ